jgi:DNA-binding transcriptional LysR family regulator
VVHLSALDLNLLVALDALLRHDSVSGAAKELGLSQPAASRTLDRLRSTLGDPLFVRAGRGLVPTDRAQELRAPVAAALVAVRQVFDHAPAFDPASATGELQLAVGDDVQVAFGARLVADLHAASPGLDVRFRPLSAASLDEGRRGLLDLAVAPDLSAIAGSVDYADFVARHLYDRRFVGIARKGTPPPDRATWLAARHAIVSFDGGGRGFVDDLLAAQGASRRVVASLTSFPAVARLVAESDVLAVVPAECAGPEHAVFALPVEVPTLPILLVWHPRRTTDPRHRFFREVVARSLGRLASGLTAGRRTTAPRAHTRRAAPGTPGG